MNYVQSERATESCQTANVVQFSKRVNEVGLLSKNQRCEDEQTPGGGRASIERIKSGSEEAGGSKQRVAGSEHRLCGTPVESWQGHQGESRDSGSCDKLER